MHCSRSAGRAIRKTEQTRETAGGSFVYEGSAAAKRETWGGGWQRERDQWIRIQFYTISPMKLSANKRHSLYFLQPQFAQPLPCSSKVDPPNP